MALLSQKQREYRRNAVKVWNVKTGATRSGKTYGDYYLLPKRIMAGHGLPGLNVILGNTKGTLTRNIIAPMQEMYGTGFVGDIRSDNTAVLFGEVCYCLGADNVRHVNRLRGSSIKYCYGDEVTTWNPEVFQMLKSRLDKDYSRFDGTCNPEGPTHWFKAFLDDHASDIYHQAYTIDDNPFNPPGVVERMKRDYAGTVYYDRYIRGLWVAAEGAVYRAFADSPGQFIVSGDWMKDHPITTATIGVDFGGTGSGHAFSCTGIERGLKGLVSLAEWYHSPKKSGRTLDPHQIEAEFVDFARMCWKEYGASIAYCDSAEQTMIQGLRNAAMREHLPVRIENARKGPINNRIRFLCRMMAAGRYHVAGGCKHTIEALTTALWDSRHTTEDVRMDNGTTNIDSLDALEYSYEPFMETMTYGGQGARTASGPARRIEA
jgi:PBSX family phage terminase large subunit